MAAPGLRSVVDAGPPPVDPAVIELLGGGLVHIIEPEERRYVQRWLIRRGLCEGSDEDTAPEGELYTCERECGFCGSFWTCPQSRQIKRIQ